MFLGARMSLFSGSSAALVVALAIALFLLMQADQPNPKEFAKSPRLGQGGYNINVISAPAADGLLLNVLANLLNGNLVGHSIRRMLLNDNGISKLRDLGAQVKLEPLHFPVHRVSPAKWNAAAKLSTAIDTSFAPYISKGIKNHPNHDSRYRSVSDYHEAFLSKKIKPSDVARKTLRTIETWDKEHNFKIFSSILPEEVLAEAYASDERYSKGKPLSVFDGVPVAFKDMMDIKGHYVYDGRSPAPTNHKFRHFAERDDTLVRRFREAGAVIMGLTLMTEGGTSPLGYNSHFRGPVSPFHRNRYSGGSSSGSAVAVATGIVPVAIGYDGGGSVRLPAAMSGVHGLATTFARIPFDNHTSITNIKCGPFATSTNDLALAYGIIARNEPRHVYTAMYDGVDGNGPPPPHIHPKFAAVGISKGKGDLSDIRLGIFKEWFNDADPAIVAECNKVVEYLRSRGAVIIDSISIPHMQQLSLSHGIKISSEFAGGWDLQMLLNPSAMEPATKIVVGLGRSTSALEVLSAEKLRAWAFEYVKKEIYEKHQLTAMLTPCTSILPPILTEAAKEYGESDTQKVMKVLRYVFLGNFLGLPGYCLPVGYATVKTNEDVHKLPVAMQLLGDHWSEHDLLRLSNIIEHDYVNTMIPKEEKAFPILFHDPLSV